MSPSLQVQVLTPTKSLLKTSARHVNVPGVLGHIGILPGHTAMIAQLASGVLKVEGEGSSAATSFNIPGGFVEVANDKVTLLLDSADVTQKH